MSGFEATPEQKAEHNALMAQSAQAANNLATKLTEQANTLSAGGKVAYIAPVNRWYRVLTNPKDTKPVSFPDKDSPRGQKMVERDNDIFLEFRDGMVILDPNDEEDAVRIAWCEANPEICRNARDPMTEPWAAMKEAQTAYAHRDPVLSPSMNVEAALRGESGGWKQGGSTTERAIQSLEQTT